MIIYFRKNIFPFFSKKIRRNVVMRGLITRSQPGFIASKQRPIEIALIEWGTLVEYQRKQSSPAYQGMLYDML